MMPTAFRILLFAALFSIQCNSSRDVVFTRAPAQDLGAVRTFVGHEEDVRCLAVSRDGKRLLSCCGSPKITNGKAVKVNDLSIRLWDIETGKQLLKLEGHTEIVDCVDISPDGKAAVSGSYDGTIRLWDLISGRETKSITAHNAVTCVGYFSDGKRFYSAGVDGTAKIWDIETGKTVRIFGVPIRMIHSVALSKDESQIFVGAHVSKVWNWDLKEGTLLNIYEMSGPVLGVAVSPDTKRLAVCTPHDPITLVDTATRKTVFEFPEPRAYEITCSKFTTDGKRFATCSGDRTLRIWDASTYKQVGLVTGFPDSLNCVVITPDDKYVIASGGGRYPGSVDHTIRMWSLADLEKSNAAQDK